MGERQPNTSDRSTSSRDRLDSWKEIAAYLKFSERTVRRWEKEGLPVHRHPHKKKAAIYAYKAEVDSWWSDGRSRLEQQEKARSATRWRGLTWLLVGSLAAALVALAALNVGTLRERLLGHTKTPRIKSLAVLPLENLSRDPEQEYFADGVTDALITELAKMSALRVISRTSVMRYKGTRKPLPQIAKELNVDAVLEGTVQRAGDRVRITAQLVDATADRHLWAESYERDQRDILALQREMAGSVAREVRAALTSQERVRLASTRPVNPEAHEAYLKGRYFWNKRTAEGFRKAVEYFQQAVEKDPGYGPPYAGLADTYALLGAAGYDLLPTSEAMGKAKQAALRALQIDHTLAEAHASLAFVKYSYDWDWAAAENEFKQAITLNPSYATARQWHSEYLSDMRRWDEAMAEAKVAAALDPFSLIIIENLARPHYFARRFDQAIEGSQRTLGMDPSFPVAHLRLGRAYAAKGMYRDAAEHFQKFLALSGNCALAMASIGNVQARAGDRRGALRMLDRLRAVSKQKRVPALYFALVHAGLDDKDRAFEWLEKAYEERSDFLVTLRVDPVFDPLRSDPRFQDLLRRVGLPP